MLLSSVKIICISFSLPERFRIQFAREPFLFGYLLNPTAHIYTVSAHFTYLGCINQVKNSHHIQQWIFFQVVPCSHRSAGQNLTLWQFPFPYELVLYKPWRMSTLLSECFLCGWMAGSEPRYSAMSGFFSTFTFLQR